MELKEILAISGQPGLYKYVAQSTHGVIVESLLDGRRMNASATSKVSSLTEISMFTEGDDIPLADVFTNPDFQQVQRLSWITLPFCTTARMFRSSSARTTLP